MDWSELPKRSRRISLFLVIDVLLVLFSVVLLNEGFRDTTVQAKTESAPEVACPKTPSSAAECPAAECPVLECPSPELSPEKPAECAAPAQEGKGLSAEERKVLRGTINDTLERFEVTLAKHIRKRRIEVVRSPRGVILRMPLKKAFQSKKPRFRKSYAKVMRVVRKLLADSSRPIVISCHTDDQKPPGRHRSNWTYSSTCAGHVARSVLRKDLIVSDRVEVRAFADTRPRVPNTTQRGREQNRRVEIELVFSP